MTRPQHEAVVTHPGHPVPGVRDGIVSLAPRPNPLFADAVAEGGGVLGELSEQTRAIMWLSTSRAGELDELLSTYPQIGWIQLPWAGVDEFRSVISAHSDRLWTSAKGAYAQPVAEHALMLTLALLRVLPLRLRAHSWAGREEGRSLFRRRLTLVGAGGIAQEFIRLTSPFDLDLTVVRRNGGDVPGAQRTTTDLHEGLRDAEIVVLAAPHTSETEHLIGEHELNLFAPEAILVNVARGALVDTDAALDAVESGHLGGLGLDVTDPEPLPDNHPLWTAPRTIITPHVADTPDMTAPLLAERIRHNVNAWVHGGEIIGRIDPHAGY